MSTIEETLKQASAAAQASAPSTAVVATPGAALPATGQRIGAAGFLNSARSSVDNYLKVSEFGLNIGTSKDLIDSFEAIIDLSKVVYCSQVRYGKPPQYFKTLDNVRATDGRPWSDILAQAKAVDPSAGSNPYSTADLVIEADGDVKTAKGATALESGKRLGYTPPYTGAPSLTDLLNDVTAAGGDVTKDKVLVTVGFEPKSGKGNSWGIVTFKFKSILTQA